MNHDDHKPGKILVHGSETGEITAELIERRAREIAVIDGRSPDEVTVTDRLQAKRELSGESLPPTTQEDAVSTGALSRDPSEPPSIPGRQVPLQNEADDQDVTERLAVEGVEEAQHDQMLAARRRRNS
ncbi:MAG: hypothetical protein JF599_00855 [Verrucomicrobia bacterium]|jgi:hypothetical protein|nr:hypothetical protein [Verrucomicrobiota bacterium]